jgi:hypothetical protein
MDDGHEVDAEVADGLVVGGPTEAVQGLGSVLLVFPAPVAVARLVPDLGVGAGDDLAVVLPLRLRHVEAGVDHEAALVQFHVGDELRLQHLEVDARLLAR